MGRSAKMFWRFSMLAPGPVSLFAPANLWTPCGPLRRGSPPERCLVSSQRYARLILRRPGGWPSLRAVRKYRFFS